MATNIPAGEKRRIMPKFLTKFYLNLTRVADHRMLPILPKRLHPFWHSALGPKTIFFWSPVIKWGLVLAGIGDLARPADTLSLTQSGSLAVTGLIWSRYSLVIIPKNWGLFSVNVFVAITQLIQLGRAYKYHMETKALEANKEIIVAKK